MNDDAARGRIAPVDEVRLLRAAACDGRLSRGDVGVYAVLLKHCDQALWCFPGPTRVSKEANLALSNVKASLKRLEELEYLSVHRPGRRRANTYQLRPLSQADQLGLPAGLVDGATRPAHRPSTRPADRLQLGLSAGHEGTSEITSESTGAGRAPSADDVARRSAEHARRFGELKALLQPRATGAAAAAAGGGSKVESAVDA